MSDVRMDGSVVPGRKEPSTSMRWGAAIALALAAVGVAMHVRGDSPWAMLPVLLGTVLSGFMLLAGPYQESVQVNAPGKRWRPRQSRTQVQGLMAVGVLAVLGVPAILFSSQFGGWTPTTEEDWVILLFAMLTVLQAVPLACPKLASGAFDGGG